MVLPSDTVGLPWTGEVAVGEQPGRETVRPVGVVVAGVLLEHGSGMPLVDDQEARSSRRMLPTKRSAIAVARGASPVSDDADVHRGEDGVEGGGDLGVAVPDKEPKSGGWRTAPATPPPPPVVPRKHQLRRGRQTAPTGGGIRSMPCLPTAAVRLRLGRRRLRWGSRRLAAGCGTAVPVRTRREVLCRCTTLWVPETRCTAADWCFALKCRGMIRGALRAVKRSV